MKAEGHLFKAHLKQSRWVDCGALESLSEVASASAKGIVALPLELVIGALPEFLRFEQPVPGMIYVFGGRCSKVLEPQHYLSSAEAYCPFRSEWYQLPSMSTRRVGAASIELHDRIYVIGGYSSHPDKPLGSCEMFNPHSGTWTSLASLNYPRFGHAVATLGGRYIYVLGGDCRRNLVSPIERYDTMTGKWEVVGQLPVPVAGGRMLERNGKFYLVGGDIGSQPLAFTEKVRMFDPVTNEWETLPVELGVGRSACGVCWAGDDSDTIAVIGGYAAEDDAFFELSTAEAVKVASLERKSIPDLPEPRAGCRSIYFRDRIYIVGGESPGESREGRRAHMMEPTIARLLAALTANGDRGRARQVIMQAMRQRLGLGHAGEQNTNELGDGDVTMHGNDVEIEDPTALFHMLLSSTPQGGAGRVLHSSTLVFNTKSWSWEAPLPQMSQPRTAAAVCVGRGYPRSFGDEGDLRWRPFTAS
jgi:hypothetical protein